GGAGGAAPADGIGRVGGRAASSREANSCRGGAGGRIERCGGRALGVESTVEAALASEAPARAGRTAGNGRAVLSRKGAGGGHRARRAAEAAAGGRRIRAGAGESELPAVHPGGLPAGSVGLDGGAGGDHADAGGTEEPQPATGGGRAGEQPRGGGGAGGSGHRANEGGAAGGGRAGGGDVGKRADRVRRGALPGSRADHPAPGEARGMVGVGGANPGRQLHTARLAFTGAWPSW